MKKLLLIPAALLVISLISCEGPQGPQGPKGDGVNWYQTSVTVNRNDWILMGEPGELSSYFAAYKPLAALTDRVYKYGTVIAYLEIDPGVKNRMPYVWHRGGEDQDGRFYWTETYDYDFVTGEIGFYVTYSDFATDIAPGTETFHVVLMW